LLEKILLGFAEALMLPSPGSSVQLPILLSQEESANNKADKKMMVYFLKKFSTKVFKVCKKYATNYKTRYYFVKHSLYCC
jgi:hypothetical protein